MPINTSHVESKFKNWIPKTETIYVDVNLSTQYSLYSMWPTTTVCKVEGWDPHSVFIHTFLQVWISRVCAIPCWTSFMQPILHWQEWGNTTTPGLQVSCSVAVLCVIHYSTSFTISCILWTDAVCGLHWANTIMNKIVYIMHTEESCKNFWCIHLLRVHSAFTCAFRFM